MITVESSADDDQEDDVTDAPRDTSHERQQVARVVENKDDDDATDGTDEKQEASDK